MKKLFVIVTIALLFQSCSSKYLLYDFKMTHPEQSKTLFHENDKFSISFDIQKNMIEVNILNKLTEGIRINWDEVSFSINGQTERAVHKSTGAGRITEVQPPTTIPPKSSLQDYLIPASKVHYSPAFGGSYSFSALFPIDEGAKKADKVAAKYKGTKVTIFIPFYIGGKYESYYYDIMIDDVRVSKYSQDELAARAQKNKKKK